MELILLSLIISYMLSANYKMLPVSELKTILSNEQRDILSCDMQIKTNNALVYFLKGGKTILMPGHLKNSSNGLLFASKNAFQIFYEKDSFPIENEERMLEDLYQDEVLHVNNTVINLISHLSKRYKVNTDMSSIELMLEKSKKGFSKKPLKEMLELSLLLGEYLRKANNGRWGLLKEYGTFNPYYTPLIVYPDGSFLLLRNWVNFFFKNSFNNCQYLLGLSSIKTPTLKLDNFATVPKYRNREVKFVE